ncbi:hypothetical protein IT575_05260 [bacterium]|nr:hypothetical protein [bacterium]
MVRLDRLGGPTGVRSRLLNVDFNNPDGWVAVDAYFQVRLAELGMLPLAQESDAALAEFAPERSSSFRSEDDRFKLIIWDNSSFSSPDLAKLNRSGYSISVYESLP